MKGEEIGWREPMKSRDSEGSRKSSRESKTFTLIQLKHDEIKDDFFLRRWKQREKYVKLSNKKSQTHTYTQTRESNSSFRRFK